jgi:ATP phosphoribosyltransferase regulatory subunit
MRREPAVPDAVLAAIRAPLTAFAPEAVNPPVLLPLGRLLDLAGEGLRTRLAVIETGGAEPMALRPDFTLGVAELHMASGRAKARYAYEGAAFTGGEPPTEFLQMGVEAYGADTDDEWTMMRAAWDAASAGGRDDLSLMIGGVGMFRAFLETLNMPRGVRGRLLRAMANPDAIEAELARVGEGETSTGDAQLATVLSKLDETDAVTVLEEVWRLAGVQPVGGRDAAEIVHRLRARGAEDAGARLSQADAQRVRDYRAIRGAPGEAIAALKAIGIAIGIDADWGRRMDAWLAGLTASGLPMDRITVDAAFARPFGYYDGMLFEVRSAALGADRPVAAGGRYNGLLARLGGKAVEGGGAVGCMVRPARAWAGAEQ